MGTGAKNPQLSHLATQVSVLWSLLHPGDKVDGGPHWQYLTLSKALTSYLQATLLRKAAPMVSDRAVAAKIDGIGTAMAQSAANGLVAGADDDWDLCPPYHRPIPHRGGPHPDPWLEQLTLIEVEPDASASAWLNQTSPKVRDGLIGQIVLQIAAIAPDGEFAGPINEVGAELGANQAGA